MDVITKYLKCELTEDDLFQLNVEIGNETREVERIEQWITDIKDKEDLSGKKKTLKGKCEKYRNGFEYRDIECYQEISSDNPDIINIVRGDTGEIINQRAATDDDRQDSMFDESSSRIASIEKTSSIN